MKTGTGLLLAALCASLATSLAAQAPAWPARPITFVVPTSAGATPDILARLLGDQIGAKLGQSIVVENRPGATGLIGMDHLSKTPADGHTIGMSFMAMTIATPIMGRSPDLLTRDLTPVTRLVWSYNALVVPSKSEIRTMDDLIRAAKQSPGKMTFASGGNGTPAHVAGEMLKRAAGIDIVHVPFNGPTPALTALAGGHVDVMISSIPAVTSFVNNGTMRAIAVTAPSRVPSMPGVPTAKEIGMPQMEIRDWLAILVPASTPPAVVSRLRDEFAAALANPAVVERLVKLGLEPAPSSPDEMRTLIASELGRWGKLVDEAKLRPN